MTLNRKSFWSLVNSARIYAYVIPGTWCRHVPVLRVLTVLKGYADGYRQPLVDQAATATEVMPVAATCLWRRPWSSQLRHACSEIRLAAFEQYLVQEQDCILFIHQQHAESR